MAYGLLKGASISFIKEKSDTRDDEKECSLKSCKKLHRSKRDEEAVEFHLFPLCSTLFRSRDPFLFILFFSSVVSMREHHHHHSKQWKSGGETNELSCLNLNLYGGKEKILLASPIENSLLFPCLIWSRSIFPRKNRTGSCRGSEKKQHKNELCHCWGTVSWRREYMECEESYASLAGMLIMINNFHHIVRCCALLSCNCSFECSTKVLQHLLDVYISSSD